MQIQEGKRYFTRAGEVTSPMKRRDGFTYTFEGSVPDNPNTLRWHSSGQFSLAVRGHRRDLVREYVEAETPPEDEGTLLELADAVAEHRTNYPEAADEDILMEALRLTSGDRQQQYGPPEKNLGTIAALWAAYKGVPFEARDVAAMMILVKVAREANKPGRDNCTDIAGYARLMHLCNEAAAKQ